MNDVLSNILLGLDTALTGTNLMFCAFGVTLGTIIGVIPGIGALTAISMIFPITFWLDPTTALIMLAGIWYGSAYGGSTAAILLNIPGTPVNAITCLDGYPMARQGRAGVALLMTTVASFVGGTFGVIILMFFMPVIARYALAFGAPEYFSLVVLGLIGACSVSNGSLAKSLAMVVLGLMFGVVGLDMYSGMPRFDFGSLSLYDGIGIVALAMGLFGVAEVIASVGTISTRHFDPKDFTLRSTLPDRDDARRSIAPMARGSVIGSFFGALPGTGPAIAAFISYAVERRVAKDPSRFGNGAIEGIAAPEAANNAADQTAFIPTLSLGIPGSPTMALMIGALMIHGIQPGPDLMIDHPDLFWGLIMSFWIGNLLLFILNAPMIMIWVRLLLIPYSLMYPAIIVFICIGAYSVTQSVFDVWMVLGFGLLGYLARVLDFPTAPLLLGFVLGPLLEENFRRSMILSQGDFTTFLTRPVSASVLAVSVLLLAWSGVAHLRERRRAARLEEAASR